MHQLIIFKNMKKFLFLLVLSAFMATSCSKDSESDLSKDLADQVVGIYSGKLAVTGVGVEDVEIRVTKVSSKTIKIEPFIDGMASTFGANLSEDKDYVYLNIPEVTTTDGGTIRGDINISEDYPDDHGAYEKATKAFGYAIKLTYNGKEISEIFAGVKK